MSDLPYDFAEMASSGDVSPSVAEQYNSEMSYLDTEDNMNIIEQVPLNCATNDHITAMSMPCFSDDAPAACGKSYEENDSEMINLDLDTSINMPLMEQNTRETSVLATGDMAMLTSKSTASTATANQINPTQHLGVDTSLFLNANTGENFEATYAVKDTDGNVKCKGLQHYRVTQFLCSSEYKYAAMRGTAILYWRFDYQANAWFSFNCKGFWYAGDSEKTRGMCRACWSANTYIKKKMHAWLYQDTLTTPSINDILPSDDSIISAIQNHFTSFGIDQTGEYIQFLSSENLRKAWSILSSNIKQVQLDVNGCLFLSQCSGQSDEDNIGHMFIAMSKFVSCCENCSYERKKEGK